MQASPTLSKTGFLRSWLVHLPGKRSLGTFLFSRSLVVTLTVFITVLATTSLLYQRLLTRQAQATAAAIAGQTYASLLALMPHGPSREEINQFIEAIKAAHASSPYAIEIYRSEPVRRQYGASTQPTPDAAVRRVEAGGQASAVFTDGASRHLYPLRAGRQCLSCHRTTQGTVLGVVEVRQELPALAARMRARYRWLFLGYGGALLGMVVLLSRLAAGRVTEAVRRFQRKTARIRSVRDLGTIGELARKDLGFAELDQAFAAVGELAERLHEVAVDRDILEFEIKLLNKFIITSNVVRDWRSFVKELLRDINTVIDTYALVAFFQEGEDAFELDVFWRSAPAAPHRRQMEAVIREKLYQELQLASDSPAVKITHHDSASPVPLPRELTRRDLELRSKSLFLDAPKVGGIVGIGVQSEVAADPIYHIVLDSVLATLLNLVGSVKAISRYTRDLEYYATRDPLTLLHNQRMFWELIGYEVHRAERHGYPVALLVIDLDNFKTVNDQHGHAFGDFFLQQLAGVIRHTVREGDLVARYGGDEFTVLLPETNQQEALATAGRLSEAIAGLKVLTRDGLSARATVSIGLALFPEHARTARDLFLVADNMMYKVKGHGKNSIALPEPEEISEVFRRESALNFQVCQALEQEAVTPFFQPILDLASGEILAHELLMRIPGENGRMLPAGEFIKAATRSGLLPRLDQLLLEKACQAMDQQGYQGKLFINLSPKAFVAPKFFATLHGLLSRYRIAPERIVVEVTERDTVKNVSLLQKFLARMKEAGYLFAVDDFGSGYSSFKYLKLFPVDFIKIEGEFIRNLTSDPDFYAYTKSIVTLARELGLKTVAEHVEDEEILRKTKELGIDFGQGFHIGRPAPFFARPPQSGSTSTP